MYSSENFPLDNKEHGSEEAKNSFDSFSLEIKEHDFQEAKNSLKKYDSKEEADLTLPKVPTSGGLFNWGNYKVTGSNLNELTSAIQSYLIDLNQFNLGLVGEFGQVYKAFEALDKDYIAGIVGAIKAAEKVSQDEQKDRADIKAIIGKHEKAVEVLKQFKADIEKLKHITDVDKAWDIITNQEKIITALTSFKDRIASITHLMDVDDIWGDVETLKIKLKTAEEKASEIVKAFEEHDNAIQELRRDLSSIKESQETSYAEFEKKLSEHQEAVSQKITNQEILFQEYSKSVERAFRDFQERLNIEYSEFSSIQTIKLDNINETQNNTLALMSEEQKSTLEELKALQEEKLALIASKQDEKMTSVLEEIEAEKAALKNSAALLERRARIAYIIAGSSVAIAVIHIILSAMGVI